MLMLRREPLNELFGEFNRMQQEFARAFSPRATAPGLALNVWHDGDNLYAEADLPGVKADTLEVTVTDGNTLTIQGERVPPEVAGAVWVRQERTFGQFARVVTLPVLVDADKIEAKYEAGVLRLTLPKSAAAKPRKIAVK